MDNKSNAHSTDRPSYEDFQPSCNWVKDEGRDTLVVTLPEFKKDQIRVQVDTKGKLKISGQRPLGGNRWSRFEKDFHIADDFQMKTVHAKLIGGLLYVVIPKKKGEPTSKPPATPTEQPQAKADTNASKPEEANGSVKRAPQPQLPPQPEPIPQLQKESQKSSANAGKDRKDKIKESPVNQQVVDSGEAKGDGRKVEAAPPEKVAAAAGKRRRARGVEFGVGGLVSQVSKRRRLVVNVAVAIVVVALGVYATYKLSSGEETCTLEN